MGWKDGAIPEQFQDVYMGHYHQSVKATLGTTMLRVAGSPESYNTFAQEVLAAMGRPSQPLQFVHPQQGVTAEYTTYLD
jgi:DNA repair exonuclease SbcCD nuclease subunit